MSDSIQPVNLAAIEQRATLRDASQIVARQEAAKVRFNEEIETAFNPAAVERQQARFGRFTSLKSRSKHHHGEARKIKEVDKKSEEDLARDYNRRNPELPANRLRALLNGLRASQSAEEILNEVAKEFRDATLADEALEFLEKQTQGAIRESVVRARALLNELRGREVIAGRNIDSVAKAFYEKGIGQDPTELRDLYRNITGNPRNHNTLFAELSESYPFDDLKAVIAFLLKSLSYDMKSKGPSIQQAELMLLMTETRNLQSILWIHLFFKSRMKMIRRLYESYGLDYDEKLRFEFLAKQFIKLVEERYPSVLKLLKQLENFGSFDELEQIIILMQFRDAIRELSPRIYQSLRHKQDLILVILESLEELEDRVSEDEPESQA